MKITKKNDLESSQKSIWFYFYADRLNDDPKPNDSSSYFDSLFTNMLIEDVSSAAFPVPDYPRRKYEIRLNASDKKCEKLIVSAIQTRSHQVDLANAIYEFGRDCSSLLMAFGQVAYEIVYFSTKKGRLTSFQICLIPPSSLIKTKNTFQQYIPLKIAKEQNLVGQHIDLPFDNILLFGLPKYLMPHHSHMMESLFLLGENFIPEFALENLQKPKVPFFHSEYLLSREVALTKATQLIGWNRRDFGTKYEFEHYVWRRQLIFYRFIIELRNSIIGTLNSGLKRVGEKLAFDCQLSVEGLPTIEDAELALQKLENGELEKFEDVLGQFS